MISIRSNSGKLLFTHLTINISFDKITENVEATMENVEAGI